MALGFDTVDAESRGPGERMHAYLSTCTGLRLTGLFPNAGEPLAILWLGLGHGNATIHMVILGQPVSLMAMSALTRPSLYISPLIAWKKNHLQ